MSYELTTLFGLGGGYLLLLFGIAYVTDRGWIPAGIVRHPAVYVLSLGVFASVWAYYTSIGVALRTGYGYFAFAIGVSLAFLLSPLLLKPIGELTRAYQLSSLADLMAFRYRSPWAGAVTTLVILVGVTPLVSLQIRAVTDTAEMLAAEASQGYFAIGFCILITLFAILFGTSRQAGRTRHDGLVMAIAFESLFKLLAFLAVGLFAVWQAFGGLEGLDRWLAERPELTGRLRGAGPLRSFHVMALMFFAGAVAMPHMFHATFGKNTSPRSLAFASWALPLYLLLLSLPVLPILWAGLNAGSQAQVEYFPVVIGAAYGAPALTLAAYLGGLSAASGLIVVVTLALSNMCLNHLILPIRQPAADRDIYRWLAWRRRLLITALIWAGFFFHLLPGDRSSLETIGIVAFTACLQFLPGILAIFYWPRANRTGFLAGLGAGTLLWFAFLLLPIVLPDAPSPPLALDWRDAAVLSLAVNSALFVAVSLLSRTTDEERDAAEICGLDTIKRRKPGGLAAASPAEFVLSLSKPLGERAAQREVTQALRDLNLAASDRRPHSLRQLRARLEVNLSGLLGPSVAREIVDGYLPYSDGVRQGASDIAVIESRIDAYRSNLSGMAADLDNLRRYHRQILLDLPLGVCSLSHDDEIVMWNRALEEFTGIAAGAVQGSRAADLEEPWASLLADFLRRDADHIYKHALEVDGRKRSVNLHRARVEKTAGRGTSHEGVIILVEDITETELLEAGLTHSERLASIGRLAAGVAHEIGNPLTGIACLAQTLRDEYGSGEIRGLAQQIIEQTDRTSRILQSLVNFAHAGAVRRANEVVSMEDCVEEARVLVSLDKKSRDVALVPECDPRAKIMGDPQKCLQILINLINNARDASRPGSAILLKAAVVGEQVVVSVSDQGAGIDPAIRDRLFDPFFTTKEAGEGTGLGLSLVYSLVEELGGVIDIISPTDRVRGAGTDVVLRFPGHFEGGEGAAAAARAGAARGAA